MSDENTDPIETTPPVFTMSEKDYDEIADRIVSKQREDKPKDKPEVPTPTTPPAATPEFHLSDEDHKGIAEHMIRIQDETAKAAEQDKKDKEKQKQEAQDNIPQAPVNLLERSLFRIGGGKRAAN